ncbi:lipo-like protein [Vibrio sp. S9_S30]|uniref:YbaY family lipoprotein n=1 Tax=Vibrio sp. S9_S30 TaxID=2720226 RepID=UPI00167FE8C8|nr:YbaY family lipoprotein [Vibrio sp. S9_S30]MBD1556464.1 lipo-like protein [Vibrio sp. S9_S30]
MKKLLVLMMTAVVSTGLVGCQKPEESSAAVEVKPVEMAFVEGSVYYRERIALPENAKVTVSLQDISLADAPSVLLVKQEFEANGNQVPFYFKLDYNKANILPEHTYSVSARIEVNGELLFITGSVFPVITDAKQTHKLDLMLVNAR